MTVFISTNEQHELLVNGDKETPIQFHEYLVIDSNTDHTIYESKSSPLKDVDVNRYKLGQKLISGIFRPCNAVVIKLSSGEWILYHARDGFDGVVGHGQDAKAFREFIGSHKNEIKEICIFEKSSPAANELKAPPLAVALSNFVNPEVEINRFKVEGYQYVVCDSKKNQILLFKELDIVSDIKKAILDSEYDIEGKIIDINNSISIEESIKSIVASKGSEKPKENTTDFVYKDNLKIPSRYSSLLDLTPKSNLKPT